MSKEYASDNHIRVEEGSQTWEIVSGQRRFRAQWNQGPGHVRFHVQKPFAENDDPDGMGIPFSSDFRFEWEDGRGVTIYGENGEYLANLQERSKRAIHWAAKRARRYAVRTIRNIPSKYWGIVKREVSKMTEEEQADLEEALANIVREWNRQPTDSQTSRSDQSPKIQRVPIEHDESNNPFDDDSSASSKIVS